MRARNGGNMNKGEFISAVAENAGLTNKQTAAAFEAMVNVIESTLKADEKIALAGFATFEIKEKPEREGINPLTKEKIKIAASKTPVVKFGNAFQDTVNEKQRNLPLLAAVFFILHSAHDALYLSSQFLR